MKRLTTILSLSILLYTASTAAAQSDEAVGHLQLDTTVRHKQNLKTLEDRTEVDPGFDVLLFQPLGTHGGFTLHSRYEDSDRLFYQFIGPALFPMDGLALGVGPGLSVPGVGDVAFYLAGNLAFRSRLVRIDGELGSDFDDHRFSANATYWALPWVGIGPMVQDDSLATDHSYVGLRIELEAKPVNIFVAMTGGLRGDEAAGAVVGLRLVP